MLNFCGALGCVLLLAAQSTHAADWIYSVVEGDNLWNLSERHLDSPLRFESLRRLNNIEYPKRMKPGTRIRIPMKWIRSQPVPASISQIRGQVAVVRRDGQREDQPSIGTRVFLGDVIRTRANSSVAVRFADGSVVTLHQASEMRFDHLSAHGTTGMVDSRLHLLDGRLDTTVTPATGPGSRFEIQTPSAISAVRGTEFRAAFDEQSSRFEVVGGKVRVGAAERSQLLTKGFGTLVRANQPPDPPRRLLPPPLVDAIPDPLKQENWSLNWQPLAGAKGYRVEIVSETDRNVLLWDKVIDRNRQLLPALPDGGYEVRVRGIDGVGLEGVSSVRQLVLDTHPRPPVLLRPIAGETLRGTSADLKWTASADAERYLLEIARDPTYEDLVLSAEDLENTEFQTETNLEPGIYHWRISSISTDGEHGPPSRSRSWHLKPVPEGVDPVVKRSDRTVVASWHRSDANEGYQLQMAYDPEFKDLSFDQLLTSPMFEFEQMMGQVRYLRLRVVEADGYLGPWGATQRIDPPEDRSAWFIPILGILGFLVL